MRIAIVDNLPDGGAKRVVYEQIRGLKNSHQLAYFSNKLQSIFPMEQKGVVTRHYDMSIKRRHGFSRLIQEAEIMTKLLPVYGNINQDIIDFGAEVIIAHPDRYTQAPFILSVTDLPAIYYSHEWWREGYELDLFSINELPVKNRVYEMIRRGLIRHIDRINSRSARRIIANSKYTAKNIQRTSKRKVSVNYPGVDTKRFTPAKHQQRNYFLFVGERDGVHGYDLVERVQQLADNSLKVKVVAWGERKTHVSDGELAYLFQDAVATLCLDRYEPFGLIPLESMACGTPVIAVKEGGYEETVVDEKTGYLIERDADRLFERMKLLAVNSELREQLGKQGVSRVNKHFTWKRHLRKLEATCKTVSET